MTGKKKYYHRKSGWENLSDEDLLKVKIRDLHLGIRGTFLEKKIAELYKELESCHFVFRPECYLADEWFCPDKEPIIGIPFYLAHPRLMNLERKMMFEVEGGTEEWCMKLLRHETGHALNYAYRLYLRTRWRELFGAFSTRYTAAYSVLPYSRRYVVHLEDHYAQAHPDEDFAETFAVWLDKESRWKEKYRDWHAYKKLKYVDNLMKQIALKEPAVKTKDTPWAADRMTSTLEAYYDRRRKSLGNEYPGFYDPGLFQIFAGKNGNHSVRASKFLIARKRHLISSVSMWSAQRVFDIEKFIKKLVSRCDSLDLYLNKSEIETTFAITAFITAVMCNTMRYNPHFARRNTVSGNL